MDDTTRPDPELDPSALLEDWLASAGDQVLPPPPIPPTSDDALDAIAWTPAAAGKDAETAAAGKDAEAAAAGKDAEAAAAGHDGGGPATLLEALASDAVSADVAADAYGDAATAAVAVDDRPRTRLVLFSVAGTMYGVSQGLVTEVARVPAITPVPHVPTWVRGVVNLRGDVLSVIDLRAFLGLESTSPHTARLVVVRLADEEFSAGLLVDAVEQIVSVAGDDVRPPSGPLEGALAPYLTGVIGSGDRLVAVLELDRLLRSTDIRQFEDRREEASCEART